MVAATNRPVDALKHDLAARFSARLFDERDDGPPEPRIAPALIEVLLVHGFTHQQRGLDLAVERRVASEEDMPHAPLAENAIDDELVEGGGGPLHSSELGSDVTGAGGIPAQPTT